MGVGVRVRGDVSDRYRQVHFCGAIIPLPLDWHEGERGELRGGGGGNLPSANTYAPIAPNNFLVLVQFPGGVLR